MLYNKPPSQEDVQSVGGMVVELVEPATSLEAPGTTELKDPKWSKGLQEFVRDTRKVEIDTLLDVGNLSATIPRWLTSIVVVHKIVTRTAMSCTPCAHLLQFCEEAVEIGIR